MDKVVHFEIPADDVGRAQGFYEAVFGWKINVIPNMDYTIVQTGPTDEKGMLQGEGFINGGMMRRQDEIKNPIITIGVDSIDSKTSEIVAHGGKIIRPKMEVGNMGFAAYFLDSENNVLGLWQDATSPA